MRLRKSRPRRHDSRLSPFSPATAASSPTRRISDAFVFPPTSQCSARLRPGPRLYDHVPEPAGAVAGLGGIHSHGGIILGGFLAGSDRATRAGGVSLEF